MRFKFSLNKACYAGETVGQDITIHLSEVYSFVDLIGVINHESIHAAINWATKSKTSNKEDHWAIKALGFD